MHLHFGCCTAVENREPTCSLGGKRTNIFTTSGLMRCDLGLVRRSYMTKLAKRASVTTVRTSVKPAVFSHTSFAIARVSEKEQQELAIFTRLESPHKNGSQTATM